MHKIKTNAIQVLVACASGKHFFIQSGIIMTIQSNRLNGYGEKHQEARICDLMKVRTADSSALLFTRMNFMVFCQSTLSGKASITLPAPIWLLTRVGALVCYQIDFLHKAFTALVTFMRFLTRVNWLVLSQPTVSCEAPTAFPALIRLLTRVDALMPYQITFMRKALITLSALIRLPMREDRQMRFAVASLPKFVCKERARLFFVTDGTVGMSGRW